MGTRKQLRAVIGVVVIGTAVGYLLYEAMESSWVYYYSVDEFISSSFMQRRESGDAGVSDVGRSVVIRLAGRVKAGTIVRNIENRQLDFELAGQKGSVAVRYYGAVPKNFIVDKEVVVEGIVDSDGVFKARRLLTRCESKYKVKLNIELSTRPNTVEEETNNRQTVNE